MTAAPGAQDEPCHQNERERAIRRNADHELTHSHERQTGENCHPAPHQVTEFSHDGSHTGRTEGKCQGDPSRTSAPSPQAVAMVDGMAAVNPPQRLSTAAAIAKGTKPLL